MNQSVTFGNFSHPLSAVSLILLQLCLVICVSVLYCQCTKDAKYNQKVKFPNSAKYMVLFTSLFSSTFQNLYLYFHSDLLDTCSDFDIRRLLFLSKWLDVGIIIKNVKKAKEKYINHT